MLPIVVPAHAWTLAILTHTVVLVAISLVPLWFGMGLFYGLGAGVGGAIFLWKSVALYRWPTKKAAIANFLASLLQLTAAHRRSAARRRNRILVMTRGVLAVAVGLGLAGMLAEPVFAATPNRTGRPARPAQGN